MKSTKILIAAVMTVLCLAGCKKDVFTGIDGSKACVTDFNYDEVNSTASAVSLYWNAEDAIKAGATSFSVQLAEYEDFRDVDMYSPSIAQTVQATALIYDAAILSGLKEYKMYYARVRANYPRSIYSDWTVLKKDGAIACISVGHGLVTMSFTAPSEIKATSDSYSEINLAWDLIGPADGYQVEYKASDASEWIVAGTTDKSAYVIGGLVELTSYDVRVKAFRNVSGETEWTDYTTGSCITAAKPAFDNNITTADQLAQFFAEIASVSGTSDVYTIANDIDMAGVSVVPASIFKGTLDGGNHSIKNLSADVPLFAENAGVIKDLVLDASCKFAPAEQIYAPLAAVNSGTMTNCVNNAPVAYTSAASMTGLVMLSGLVVRSTGTLDGCVNNGPVSFTVNGSSEGWAVAGVAAFVSGPATNCKNTAKVSCSVDYCSKRVAIEGVAVQATSPGNLGGVFCYGGPGMTVSGCENSGEVSYNVTKIDGVGGNINRNQIAGVIAAPCGNISNCVNKGAVNVLCICSEGKTISTEYIVGVAGISGGDYFAKGDVDQNASNIDGCTNEGDINVQFDASKSNSTVGGIVAWPGVEGVAQTVVTSNCINRGNVTVSGKGKGRFGGVQGGSGNITKCKNYGTITNKTSVSGSCVGGVCGYRNYQMTITECENYGNVVNEHGELVYTGGLIGAWGGQDFNSAAGCAVDCELVVSGAEGSNLAMYTGMIIGRFNGDKSNTLGSADAPIKVNGAVTLGTVKTVLSADNYTTMLAGNERTLSVNGSDPSCNRQIFASFGK
ncbi:MAG: fibronectin type III domain-containing protein [Bacteroidales bacterium]|nr:fibronectin type III domain-containing protein [Bacteroidales bacterium]